MIPASGCQQESFSECIVCDKGYLFFSFLLSPCVQGYIPWNKNELNIMVNKNYCLFWPPSVVWERCTLFVNALNDDLV